jgi:uncharacterized protein (DUF2141 family)
MTYVLNITYKTSMNKIIILAFVFMSFKTLAEEVTISLTNLGPTGEIGIAVHNDQRYFPDDAQHALISKFFALNSNQGMQKIILDLPPGFYAISTFQDKNSNKKLDTNLVGAPKERFGFSNNPRVLFSAPSFYDAEFEVKAGEKKKININLIKFF